MQLHLPGRTSSEASCRALQTQHPGSQSTVELVAFQSLNTEHLVNEMNEMTTVLFCILIKKRLKKALKLSSERRTKGY